MNFSLIHRTDALTISIVLFISMIIFFIFGRYVSKFFPKEDNESKPGMSSLTAAMFALFGFILAFAFSISGHRYDAAREIFVNESEHIGTAILRSDLYPDSVRQAFRKDFKDYLEARIKLYSNVADTVLIHNSKAEGTQAVKRLWHRTMYQSRLPNMLIPSNNMVLALNNMFNVATKREVIMKTAIPDPIIYMLFVLALVSSFIAGISSPVVGRKDWIVIVCYILFSSLIIYITLDMGRPMRGLIKAEIGEQSIKELRALFIEND